MEEKEIRWKTSQREQPKTQGDTTKLYMKMGQLEEQHSKSLGQSVRFTGVFLGSSSSYI